MKNCRSCGHDIPADKVIRGTMDFELFYQCNVCKLYTHEEKVSDNHTTLKLYKNAPYALVMDDFRRELAEIKPSADGSLKGDSIRHQTAQYMGKTILAHINAFVNLLNENPELVARYGITAGLIPAKPDKEYDVNIDPKSN